LKANNFLRIATRYLIAFLLISALLPTNSFARKRKIKIKNTDSLVFSEKDGRNIRKLYGHVQFEHDGGQMFCDSAYFYVLDNIFDAFNNVHICQNDSVNLYGDKLYFDGNTQLAKIRGNVKLIDGATTLTTRFLDYDMKESIAYYFDKGHIISNENTLDSRIGKYFETSNEFFFKDDVVLVNPDYVITSDTLKYNTVSEIAYFFGPTEIKNEENYIYCENGWYDTKKNISQFQKNSYLNNGPKFLYGDSIFYNRNLSYGEAFENVKIIDTAQKSIAYGHYAYYKEKPEYITVTDSIMLVQVMQGDSLFMHGDSLIAHFDSTESFRLAKVYNHVRFFKTDLQGKCDSLVFTFEDTTLEMHTDPIIWSENYQVTGNQIDVHLKDENVDKMYVFGNAFLVSQDNETQFNQVKGNNMTGYVRDKELYRIDVNRNGETIYFLRDETELLGVNKAECTDITVYLKDSQVNEIVFKKKPIGTMYPPQYLMEDELFLDDFQWRIEIRPQSKEDIFIWK